MSVDFIGKVIFGDNLIHLKKMETGSVNLIYIDPPFNTGRTQSRRQLRTVKSTNGNRIGFKGNYYETIEVGVKAYNDSYGDQFISNFIKPRLIEAYRVLSPNGSMYFHIDYREVHYCKILLDEIFGRDCFINEIIWAYDYGAKSKTRWPTKHDNILFYVKNPDNYIFNSHLIDREPYMAPGLVNPEKALIGKLPTDTWWHTIVGTSSRERTGYPTQKPIRLINRIIQASSLPGDTVMDFFAGSGTIAESCIKLNRKFIIMDNNPIAIHVIAKRLSQYSNIDWIDIDPQKYQKNEGNIPSDGGKTNFEFELLASMAMSIRTELVEQNEVWEDSPFSWVTELSAAKKGKLGKSLILAWLRKNGIAVAYDPKSLGYLKIHDIRVAVKFSTLWVGGCYKFQQIRDNGYDLLICLGISPHQAHCWAFPKDLVIKNSTPQHKGTKGAEYWLSINPDEQPKWVNSSGSLASALNEIRKLIIS